MKCLASVHGVRVTKEELCNDATGSKLCAQCIIKQNICDVLILAYLNPQAVLVDMEEGVVNEILQGPLREVFDSGQLLTDVSGSGNNW